jgi:hypothetical protein
MTLTVDDEYAAAGDTLKLLPLAACNHCSDYLMQRRKVLDPLGRICKRMAQDLVPNDQKEKTKEVLEGLLKRYMRMMADFRGVAVPDWDAGVLEAVLANPANYVSVLSHMPTMFEQQRLLT